MNASNPENRSLYSIITGGLAAGGALAISRLPFVAQDVESSAGISYTDVLTGISILFGAGVGYETNQLLLNQEQLKELTDKVSLIHQELLPNQKYAPVHPVDLLESQISNLEKELGLPSVENESIQQIKYKAIGTGLTVSLAPYFTLLAGYIGYEFDLTLEGLAPSLLFTTISLAIITSLHYYTSKVKSKMNEFKERFNSIRNRYFRNRSKIV